MTSSLGAGLLWFIVIIALIPVALWLLKRTPYGAGMSASGSGTRQVSSMALGPHQRIVTVEVGQGDERRWLVLGVTPQSISTLHTLLPQAEVSAGVPSASPLTTPFAALLSRVRDARA